MNKLRQYKLGAFIILIVALIIEGALALNGLWDLSIQIPVIAVVVGMFFYLQYIRRQIAIRKEETYRRKNK